MASDKPNGSLSREALLQEQQVDVTEFLRHLHGDIISLAIEHTAIFWIMSAIFLERCFYYGYHLTRWLVS